jgi:UDP-N-acetylglucosamine/UDP-N-acetylgalactosamine diphosphorylase
MPDLSPDLLHRLHAYGQTHALAGWERLDDPERDALLGQLQALDLAQLQRLYARRAEQSAKLDPSRVEPPPVTAAEAITSDEVRRGEEALRRGEVAALVVAGGQGSRLGFEHPKGLFPIGPVTERSLFRIHAEKVLALTRRYGRPVPLLVMTSPATDAETRAFFAEHRNFGLPPGDVAFFQQGTMPALDLATGRLLLERPGVLFLSPNGHGGTLTALRDSGLLAGLRGRGVKQVFYFQVDNPLVKIADPAFLGHHLAADAEVSTKVVEKTHPAERVGVLGLTDGRCSIIEYSDLPEGLAPLADEGGRLRYRAGSPAIHVFDLAFLERVTRDGESLPFHLARKKVPYTDPATGYTVTPTTENALKFERFIFDALPLAERWTAVWTTRREEFAPLKNGSGPDSPATVRQALSDLAADRLEQAGVTVPRRPDGAAAVMIEMSPLFALEGLDPGMRVEGPTVVR